MFKNYAPTAIALLLLGSLAGNSQAPQPVVWSTSSSAELKPGARATVDLSATIQDGWHVYALSQTPGGPFPLKVAVDENPEVANAGSISGTAPVRKHDASFDLDTETYTHAVVLHVPVQLKPSAATGKQLVPISVRYQACSDQVCMPPKTVHLSVPIQVNP